MQPFSFPAPALFGFRRGEHFAACFNFGDQAQPVDIGSLSCDPGWQPMLDDDADNGMLPPWGIRWWWRA